MKEQDQLHQGVQIREEVNPLKKGADQYTIVEGGRKLGYIVYSVSVGWCVCGYVFLYRVK